MRWPKQGFAVDWYASQMVAGAAAELRRYPHAAAALAAHRPAAGPALDRRDRPAAAAGSRRHFAALADEGLRGFYEGASAAALLADCAELGVPIDAADLAGYRARLTAPLTIGYRSDTVLAMPGPFAGGSLARCLELLAAHDLGGAAPSRGLRGLRPRPGPRPIASGSTDRGVPQRSCTSHLSVVDAAATWWR